MDMAYSKRQPHWSPGKQSHGSVEDDFNGDGKPDLAVANGTGISFFLGNGDGTFSGAIQIRLLGAFESPLRLVSADLNHAGVSDLVVTLGRGTPGGLAVMLG